MRHRLVPERVVGSQVVLARPSDGAPLLLAPTAALVWVSTQEWVTNGDLETVLADEFPEVSNLDRTTALLQILQMLDAEGLLDRAG